MYCFDAHSTARRMTTQACRIAHDGGQARLRNARWSIERTCRDHAMRVDTEGAQSRLRQAESAAAQVQAETDSGSLRADWKAQIAAINFVYSTG